MLQLTKKPSGCCSQACASLPDKLAAACRTMVDKWGEEAVLGRCMRHMGSQGGKLPPRLQTMTHTPRSCPCAFPGSALQAVVSLDRPCDVLGSCTWSALTAASRQSEERGSPLLAAPRTLIQAAHQAMTRAEQQLGQLQDASPCDKCKVRAELGCCVMGSAWMRRLAISDAHVVQWRRAAGARPREGCWANCGVTKILYTMLRR
jgi:hypothetical protein